MSQSPPSSTLPSRQATVASTFSDDAVPDTDPSSTAGLLAQRLQAWHHAIKAMSDYMEAVEKVHHSQAKDWEKVLKVLSKPLKEGHHFDQTLGGIAGFMENVRVNTQSLVNTNIETEKNLKGSVLPILDRLLKEIKHKTKELSHGAQKGAKDVEKARNTTQKHIELLGQHTAAFESSGGKSSAHDDPYVILRQTMHRLHHQTISENNHRNDLIAVQANFQTFEQHIIEVLQQSFESFHHFVGGQAEKTLVLYADMLGACQSIPPGFEWEQFVRRSGDLLVNPSDDPRTVDSIQFPNMSHVSTKPLIEGSLERKSRNKLDWRYTTGYYVVTPSKFLHEFKDNDDFNNDPKPELSIFLPDAVIGSPNGEKFNIKGKDKSKTMSSKLTGSSELAFKAHSAADAQKWFDIIRNVVGATGPADPSSPVAGPPCPPEEAAHPDKPRLATSQEAGVTGGETFASPTTMSPISASTAAKEGHSHPGSLNSVKSPDTAATSPTAVSSTKEEKA